MCVCSGDQPIGRNSGPHQCKKDMVAGVCGIIVKLLRGQCMINAYGFTKCRGEKQMKLQ